VPKGMDHCSSEEYRITATVKNIDAPMLTRVLQERESNISSLKKKTFLVFLWL
jgi:hypothetical protein